MKKFTLREIWKQQILLLGIYAGNINTKISISSGVNLRTSQRITKELNESNGDYKGTVARKPHSDRLHKIRTPKFVGDIKAEIDNHPSQFISSITRDIGVSEFLIRQVVRKDIGIFKR